MAKTYKVILRSGAEDDLADLYDFIAADSGARTAGAYLERIYMACRAQDTFPMRGSSRQDLGAGIRTVGFERRATIAFRVLADEVEILRVFHGGQDIGRHFDS